MSETLRARRCARGEEDSQGRASCSSLSEKEGDRVHADAALRIESEINVDAEADSEPKAEALSMLIRS
jgi:hypothetical protein